MSRKPRVISSTGIYHITLRSINQHIIFEEDKDYQKFLYNLADSKSKYDVDIYAYCLMDNHVHLLLRAEPDQIASFFQSLGSKFVRWYNTKYSRCGHLFQDRYFSSPIEDMSYFLSVVMYIHNNPVKANICTFATDYRWSSARAFYGAKNSLVNVSFSYNIAGSKALLLQFFAHNDPENNDISSDVSTTNRFISDEKALILFKSITQLPSAAAAANLDRSTRNQYILILRQKGLTHSQIMRLMDVSLSTVKRICTPK